MPRFFTLLCSYNILAGIIYPVMSYPLIPPTLNYPGIKAGNEIKIHINQYDKIKTSLPLWG